MKLRYLVCTLILCSVPAFASDWAQWRGPGRDGVVANFPALPESLTNVWDVEAGFGHASPIFYQDKIYLFSRDGEEENLKCLDPKTGKTLWKQGYDVAYNMNPAAFGHGKGPKATPVGYNGHIYVFGITGVLSCYEAKTGKQVWQETFKDQYQRTDPLYGQCLSPMIHNGMLITHVGGPEDGAITAVDAKTGKVAWQWKGDGPGYASPIVAKLGGVDQLVTQTRKLVVSLNPDNGKLLWKLPLETDYDQNSVTPVVLSDMLYISGLDKGTYAYKPTKDKPVQVWHNPDVSFYMSTPVVVNGDLYGMANKRAGMFVRLNGKTGEQVWGSKGRQGKNAALVALGDKVMSLSTGGNLKVFATGTAEYQELKDYDVSKSPAWAHPAFSDGRILVKGKDRLYLVSAK